MQISVPLTSVRFHHVNIYSLALTDALFLSILPAESSQNSTPFPSKMAQLAAICKMQLEEQSR